MASQMQCRPVDIEEAVNKALKELKDNKLIPDYEEHEQEITKVLMEAARKEATLTTKMGDMIDNTMPKVEQEMSEILGQKRVNLIKKSFAIETYRMKVAKKPDGQSAVQVHWKGVEFQPQRMLMTSNDITSAKGIQAASLIAEVILFVLSCNGINVDVNETEMRNIVQEVEKVERKPEFGMALDKLLTIWNGAGGSVWGKAKAIFYFLKDSYSLGMFWKIIKLIFQDMSTWQMIRSIAEVALMIVVAFATEGVALIARIVLAINDAVYLAEKIANLVMFSYM